MDEEKVYVPTIIQENPFPQEAGSVSYETSQSSSNETYTPQTTKAQSIPAKRVAVELIGTAINTKSRKILQKFEFTKNGAIQIGEYENGVSGDIRITPDGIVARNISGITTIAIEGDTGDATFAGTVQAGAIIGGAVAVGDGSILIDGETKRMIWYDDDGIPSIVIGEI